MPPPQRSPLVFFAGAVTAAFLIFAGFIVHLLWQTENSPERTHYNEGNLGVVELRLFHAELLRSLHDLESNRSGVSVNDAVLAYDIVYERLNSMPVRPPFPEILDKETKDLLVRVFDEWAALAPVFDKAAETGDPAPLIALNDRFEQMGPAFSRIAGRAEQLAGEARDRVRGQNLNSLKLLAAALVGLMVSSLIFAVMMRRSLKTERTRAREPAAAHDEAL